MAYKIEFFGHCSEANHDKVWGYVSMGDNQLYNFWGRRGKKFAFQKHELNYSTAHDLQRKANEKCSPRKNGAYKEIPINNIEQLVPGFYAEFERQLTLAKLFDNFRHKVDED
jgi:hypothetical protein